MVDRNPLFECLIRIRNLPDMAPFRAFLADEIEKETKAMVGQSDQVGMWRAQGGVRVLTKLKELIENSDRVLEKRAASTSGSHFLSSSNSP
jgi:hypothetical protein